MSQAFCQNCGAGYAYSPGGVVGRTATCESCGRDLHACVNCAHYDPKAYNECHEPNAERVDDRKSSNFCDYFKVVPAKPAQPGAARAATREQAARDKLNSLFKKPGT
jgi:hypothetical protein